ncbi:DUF4124 domain-containing protein [Niveibacterium sp. SC-1]|uniref:DUF4124 domain-containing protein n=1 Tax=Niveibacterium sp. SC-1 TaxID=3135646 RepID=UPI00311E2B79
MFLRAPTVFLIFVFAAAAAQAGVYKWTDAQGKVHYGDVPPPEQRTDRVNVQPAAAPSDDIVEDDVDEPATRPAKKPRDARADAAREAERAEASRRQACDDIRREQRRIDAAPSGKAITGEQRELRGKMVEQNAAAARHYRCE